MCYTVDNGDNTNLDMFDLVLSLPFYSGVSNIYSAATQFATSGVN